MNRPRDTTADAAEAQINAYRRMGPDGRLRVGLELTEMSRQLMRQGIRHRHPEYDEADVESAFLLLWLGPELFRQVYPGRREVAP